MVIILMNCPYCNNNMYLGKIHGNRYPLKWISEEKTKERKFPFAVKKIKLTSLKMDTTFENYNTIDAFYCNSCKKIIIDISNTKNI